MVKMQSAAFLLVGIVVTAAACDGNQPAAPAEQAPAAAETPLPPSELEIQLPPGVRERSHGLLLRPWTGLLVWLSPAMYGVLVLPQITAPAARSRATAAASAVRAGLFAYSGAPDVAGADHRVAQNHSLKPARTAENDIEGGGAGIHDPQLRLHAGGQ